MNTDFAEVFRLFDRDNSGSVSDRELGTVLHSLGCFPTDAEIDGMLRHLSAFHEQKALEQKLASELDADPRAAAVILRSDRTSSSSDTSASLAALDSLLLQLESVMQATAPPPPGAPAQPATLASFTAFLQAKLDETELEEELRSALTILQLPNKIGYVQRVNFEQTLTSWCERLSKDEFSELMKEVEVLEDGTISIDDCVRSIMLKGF